MSYSIPSVAEILKNTSNGKHKFEVVSLFAGGGGSSTGYRMAGGKVLAINEFVPQAQETYKANYPDVHIISDDIRQISGAKILDLIGKKENELDLLDGSPPCSAFSMAGKRNKNWGKVKAYSSTKQANVEDLFFDFTRVLREIKPKTFIAENVAGLCYGKAKGYLNDILREMNDAGYIVKVKLIDALWLGVPQRRKRTIFVGIRKDLWLDKYKNRTHPRPHKKIVTLGEAFKGLKFTDQDRIETDETKYAVYKLLKTLVAGRQHYKRFNLVKLSPTDASYCITATSGTKGAARPMHWDNRALTIGETKRIMSVPDDFILTGTYGEKTERLGRMVAPFMMKEVSSNLQSLGVFK